MASWMLGYRFSMLLWMILQYLIFQRKKKKKSYFQHRLFQTHSIFYLSTHPSELLYFELVIFQTCFFLQKVLIHKAKLLHLLANHCISPYTFILEPNNIIFSTDSPRDSVQFIEWSPRSCPRALLIANFHGRITIWTQPSQVNYLFTDFSFLFCNAGDFFPSIL